MIKFLFKLFVGIAGVGLCVLGGSGIVEQIKTGKLKDPETIIFGLFFFVGLLFLHGITKIE